MARQKKADLFHCGAQSSEQGSSLQDDTDSDKLGPAVGVPSECPRLLLQMVTRLCGLSV